MFEGGSLGLFDKEQELTDFFQTRSPVTQLKFNGQTSTDQVKSISI